MKRIAFLGLLVAVALLSVASVTKAEAPFGVRYDCMGPDGALTVVGAEGRVVTAICSEGFIVFQSVVHGEHFEVMVPHTGEGADGTILLIDVKNTLFFVDTDDDWIWE